MNATVGSLCTGIGGLDLALAHHGWTVAWQAENDPHCAAVLARHWPGVPNHGDIREIDYAQVPPVDLVCAGFPCQPVSDAGRRAAQEDPRWLWPEVARCVRDLRPRYVFLENVAGLLGRGFGDVLGDLAALGLDAVWDCVRASDVGAPHQRERVFVLAYAQRGGRDGLHERVEPGHLATDAGQRGTAGRGRAAGELDGRGVPGGVLAYAQGLGAAQQPQGAHPAALLRGGPGAGGGAVGGDRAPGGLVDRRAEPGGAGAVADALGGELQRRRGPGELGSSPGSGAGQGPQRQRDGHAPGDRGAPVADADGPGSQGRGPAGQNGRPGPADPGWRRAEPGVGGGPDGLPRRLDGHRWPAPPGPAFAWEPPRTIPGRSVPDRGARLKALGNAVVPHAAALAFALLWQRMEAV